MLTAGDLNDKAELGITAIAGRADRAVERVAPLSEAARGALTFIGMRFDLDKLSELAGRLDGCTVICAEGAAQRLRDRDATLLVAANPRLAFLRAVQAFFPPPRPAAGIHPLACVHPTAEVDPSASIGPFCVVGEGCKVAAGAILHPNVVLYPRVSIGRNAIVNAGTAIGADGFGYERNERGELEKFPHIGGVIVEDEVEIGSNTSIDRGTVGNTIIRRGARIDNQVHIAHNVVIGENAAVIAQAMVGGSVRIGANAWIAPAGIVIDQVAVGEGAVVGLGAVVTKTVPDGQTVMGSPAQPDADFKADRAALKALIARHRAG